MGHSTWRTDVRYHNNGYRLLHDVGRGGGGGGGGRCPQTCFEVLTCVYG